MSPTGILHLTFSLLAIVFGAVVLLLPKGTRWHRSWGHGYVWTMIGVVVTSFAMFDLTGRVTPFHVAAVAAGATLAVGMWTVLGRRPRKSWIHAHAAWMAWSYVGLMAAFVAESLTRFVMPAAVDVLDARQLWPVFWTVVAVGSLATVAVGGWMIRRTLPEAVRRTPEAIRAEQDAFRSAPSEPSEA